jgi:hypothetical protein
MLRLRTISLFLALVMSIQMLPIADIGTALSSNLWTEELPHADDTGKADVNIKNYLPVNDHHFLSQTVCQSEIIYIHRSEQIPSNHSTDVVSPPPDRIS